MKRSARSWPRSESGGSLEGLAAVCGGPAQNEKRSATRVPPHLLLELKELGKTALRRVRRARREEDYPATNGRAGGKLPAGKTALRLPCRSFSAACRKAATNQA